MHPGRAGDPLSKAFRSIPYMVLQQFLYRFNRFPLLSRLRGNALAVHLDRIGVVCRVSGRCPQRVHTQGFARRPIVQTNGIEVLICAAEGRVPMVRDLSVWKILQTEAGFDARVYGRGMDDAASFETRPHAFEIARYG